MTKLSVVGIDIAKQVFPLVGMDEHGTLVVRRRLYRAQVMACIAQLPPTLIGMEACGGVHYWARRFREHGHEVKRMAPQFVKPECDQRELVEEKMRDHGQPPLNTC